MRTISRLTSLLLCLQAAAGASGGLAAAGIKISTLSGGKKKAMVMVLPDGRIAAWKDLVPGGPDGKNAPPGTTIGKASGDAIADTSGSILIKLEADGGVVVSGMKGKPHFNASDELLDEKGARLLWLTPEGMPMLNMSGNPGPLPFKVEGVTAGNRRMAVLLTLFMHSPRPVQSQDDAPRSVPAPDPKPEAAK